MERLRLNNFMAYFFRGLLFVAPIALTIYIITIVITWLDNLIPVDIPGLGLVIILGAITMIGYLATFFITRPLFQWMEKYLSKIPFAKIIYTSIKDLIGAFVGDKKKFDSPVLITLNEEKTLYKVGFITQEDMANLDLPGLVSVYLPHSYNFSGNHFLVAKETIQPLNMNGTDAMKFVVSGGVSGV